MADDKEGQKESATPRLCFPIRRGEVASMRASTSATRQVTPSAVRRLRVRGLIDDNDGPTAWLTEVATLSWFCRKLRLLVLHRGWLHIYIQETLAGRQPIYGYMDNIGTHTLNRFFSRFRVAAVQTSLLKIVLFHGVNNVVKASKWDSAWLVRSRFQSSKVGWTKLNLQV